MIKEKEILINNLKINYKIAGQGPVILILHGWGGSSDSWIKVQEILTKEGYQVICPDLPGFGKSKIPPQPWSLNDYREWLNEFINSLGLKEFCLLGHSFGGGLAVKFSTKYTEKVKSLILTDAAVIRKKRPSFRQMIAFFLAKVGYIFLSFPFFGKIFYPLARKIIYKIAGTHDYYFARGVMKETFKKTLNEDLSQYLSKIKIPTLIIWGEKDKNLPLNDGFLISKLIPNSKVKIIDGANHSPHRKTPEKLVKIIIQFIKS